MCPDGWHLPTSSGESSFNTLVKSYGITNNSDGSSKLQASPFYFVRGGNVTASGSANAGVFGAYWTSFGNSGAAHILYFNDSSATPTGASTQFRGNSVRCLAS